MSSRIVVSKNIRIGEVNEEKTFFKLKVGKSCQESGDLRIEIEDHFDFKIGTTYILVKGVSEDIFGIAKDLLQKVAGSIQLDIQDHGNNSGWTKLSFTNPELVNKFNILVEGLTDGDNTKIVLRSSNSFTDCIEKAKAHGTSEMWAALTSFHFGLDFNIESAVFKTFAERVTKLGAKVGLGDSMKPVIRTFIDMSDILAEASLDLKFDSWEDIEEELFGDSHPKNLSQKDKQLHSMAKKWSEVFPLGKLGETKIVMIMDDDSYVSAHLKIPGLKDFIDQE